MSLHVLSALILFIIVASITPGPNNLMVMASGVNYGYRRTVPHLLGVAIGYGVMIALVGLGMMSLFDAVPVLSQILLVFSVLYLLYLAWQIATADAPGGTDDSPSGKPFSFFQAAGFQWLNPKSWTAALSMIAIYAPDRSLTQVGLIALLTALICLPTLSLWTFAGSQFRNLLDNRTMLRVFNWSMAVLLLASLVPILLH